jgi:hypothetical protein
MKMVNILTFFFCAVIGVSSFAQEDEHAKHKEQKEQLFKELGLTEEQQSKMEAMHKEMKTQMRSIKEDTSLDAETRKAKIESMKEQHIASLGEFLSDEQIEKLTAHHEAMKAERKEKTPGEIANKKTERLKELLDLTAEQEEQVRTLNLKVALKVQAIKEDDSMSAEKKKAFIKGNMEDHKRVMDSILTAEQLEIYEDFLAKKKAKKAQRNKGMNPSTEEKSAQ